MPITRRRRANPPEQPENNNHVAEQGDHAVEVLAAEQTPLSPITSTDTEAAENGQAETNNSGNIPTMQSAHEAEATPSEPSTLEPSSYQVSPTPAIHTALAGNTERQERPEITPIEGGRRTARGELFRRPPMTPAMPAVPPVPPVPAVQLQPPSHEITLPLGKKPGDIHGDPLHLAYNPGYTGADEVRSILLHKLAQESKNGGRARCWSCGSIAIVYDRWSTRNKTFGEIGVAFCEICGVWSVL